MPAPAPDSDPCEILPWDSAFFGFTIARARTDTLTPATLQSIDDWCRAHAVRCLYFDARPDDPQTIELAQQRGYELVDERLTFGRDLAAVSHSLPPSIRPARDADLPALSRIARASHHDTRFFVDINFSPDRAHDLYEEWIRASYNGFAQAVLVANHSPEPLGYVTCHLTPDKSTGSIGLIAVDAAAQGKGLGRALVEAATAFLAAQGARHMTIVTQRRNLIAQRLYERCGFIAERLQLYYHLWY